MENFSDVSRETFCETPFYNYLSVFKPFEGSSETFQRNFVFPRSYRSPEAMQKAVLWSVNCEGQI